MSQLLSVPSLLCTKTVCCVLCVYLSLLLCKLYCGVSVQPGCDSSLLLVFGGKFLFFWARMGIVNYCHVGKGKEPDCAGTWWVPLDGVALLEKKTDKGGQGQPGIPTKGKKGMMGDRAIPDEMGIWCHPDSASTEVTVGRCG